MYWPTTSSECFALLGLREQWPRCVWWADEPFLRGEISVKKTLNARLGGGRWFLAGKIFDTRKGGKSIDSLAEMLMKFLSFHTASTHSSLMNMRHKAVTQDLAPFGRTEQRRELERLQTMRTKPALPIAHRRRHQVRSTQPDWPPHQRWQQPGPWHTVEPW